MKARNPLSASGRLSCELRRPVSGGAALVTGIPGRWLVFPQLQNGAWQIADIAVEAAHVVLFDYERTERGVDLRVFLACKSWRPPNFVMPTISHPVNHCCDMRRNVEFAYVARAHT